MYFEEILEVARSSSRLQGVDSARTRTPYGSKTLPPWHVGRPRIVDAIDERAARIVVLRAPAGFGKSVAALEWAALQTEAIFFSVGPHDGDIVAFTAGLLDAISRVRPTVGRHAVEHAELVRRADGSINDLAEKLTAEIDECDEDAVLVLDDYHHLGDSASVDGLVSAMIDRGSKRVVVTTRATPSWATPRRLIENVVSEIGPATLSMTPPEAASVLRRHSRSSVRRFLRRADGWPALVGLAAVAETLDLPAARMRRTLYRYFAEEVLRKESPEARELIMRAAVPLAIRQSTLEHVLGASVEQLLARLIDDGLLHEAEDGTLVFHSLLRDFLLERLRESQPETLASLVDSTIDLALREARWEEAFELARSLSNRGAMVRVVAHSARDIAGQRHLEKLARWVKMCGPPRPAETGLRVAQLRVLADQSKFEEVCRLAPLLLPELGPDDPATSAVWSLLGNSLHFRSMHAEALDAYVRSCETAGNERGLYQALWCAVSAAYAAEDVEALERLVARLTELPVRDLDQRLLTASAQTLAAGLTHRTGGLWRVVEPLVDEIDGASYMATMRILNAASALANGRAEYETGRRIAEQARSLHREYGVTSPFAFIRIATAELGLRDFKAARRTIEEIAAASRDNSMVGNELLILRAKLTLFEQGPGALLQSSGKLNGRHGPAEGEYHGLRAIASAAIEDRDRAGRAIERATSASCTIEVSLVGRFAALISRIRTDGTADSALAKCLAVLRDAEAADILDPLVVAYRAFPALLQLYSSDPWASELVAAVAQRANDQLLAAQEGVPSPSDDLTPRERQIFSLLADGMSNKEISERLVISIHTTKVHVHHILEKLGLHDRIGAIRLAASVQRGEAPT
jgi:ATP/maltotriose-dependent transcriptional regulator MalT